MKMMFISLAWVIGTISLASWQPVSASREFSTEQIREWVRDGSILSLEDILQRNPQAAEGRLLDLEVEREHGRIVYELEVLHEDGQVTEYEIDAASGQLLKQKIED